ncbi:MAG TPA: DUF1499 domain-containing protein [Xanthomonadaceae bacterium]|nr:DUF1499 domain-containing protein [Xanthomonadaceae bacterium]
MKPARIVMLVAAVAVLMLLAAGPGHRFGLWEFATGFSLMRWAAWVGIAAAALALVALLVPRLRRGHAVGLAIALLAGLAAAALPWQMLRTARAVPPIHDISTDTVDPPAFEDVLPLRADAPNPAVYEGEAIAQQQRAAYPEVQPLTLDDPPEAAFERALAAARDMGWEIVASDPERGRIEATATTFWFGFKDDVVVRVRPEGAGARVDVRSLSRVGRSDVGANAARIRAYLDKLET